MTQPWNRGQRPGMEVGEARIVQTSAQEKLIVARVDARALDPGRLPTSRLCALDSAGRAIP
ncbi:MAG: hypothetical protein ACE5IP_05860 [Terriglobia bacterium]